MNTLHPSVLAVLLDRATEEERAAVEAWRGLTPANDLAFRVRARLWRELGEIGLPASTPRAAAPRRWRFPAWAAPIAAVVVLALTVGPLVLGRGNSLLGAESVVTGAGEVTTLTLNDGTVVRLGPESRLAFRGLGGPRDVYLEGQAFFAVQPGLKDRFRVHTGGGELTVLGTRFDVQARDRQVRVVVVQGEVEMDARGERISVGPRQMGRVEPGASPVVQPVEDVYRATAWIGDFLAFESTPLREVATELEKRYGLQILIVDPRLEAHLVTGWFKDRSPHDMLASICWVVNARCTLADGTVRIDRPRDFQRGQGPRLVEE